MRQRGHRNLRMAAAACIAIAAGFGPAACRSAGDRPGSAPETAELQIAPVRYDLDLTVDFDAERIAAVCRLEVRNVSDRAAGVLPLLLYRLLKVESIRDGAGRDLPFDTSIEAFADWAVLQVGSIRVRPPRPLAPGASTVLEIGYGGPLAGYVEAMRYVKDKVDPAFTIVRMDPFAYPQPGVPSWAINRAGGLPEYDYRIRATVPETHVAANGGRLVERTAADGKATYVYESLRPVWRMDVAVAPYEILRDDDRPLRVYHFRDDAEGAGRVMAAMKAAMDLFTGWFGPLPGDGDFAVIEVPEGYGSQADYTVVLQTRDAFLDPERLDQLYHEISHLWSVRARDPLPSRFESEGLAMFLQYLARERLEGRTDAVAAGLARVRESFRKSIARDARLAGIPMIDYGKAQTTDLSYTKGMIFFALLHRLMGEESFLGTLRSFVAAYRETGATAVQFMTHFAAAGPAALRAVFEDWITGTSSSDLLLGPETLEEIFSRYEDGALDRAAEPHGR